MADWYLYAIRLSVNDYAIAYVGVTKNFRRRSKEHWQGYIPIDDAIRMCGKENVIFQRLVRGGKDFIYNLESEAITAFKTRWPNGYNQTAGGYGCRDPLPQTLAKLVAAGVKHNQRPEIRAILAVRNNSPEHLAMLAARNSSSEFQARRIAAIRSPENLAKLAASRTPEWRAKVGKASGASDRVAALIARNKSPESRERGKKNTERLTAFARSPENRARVAAMNKTTEHKAAQVSSARAPENLARLAAMGNSPENIARLIARNKSRATKAV